MIDTLWLTREIERWARYIMDKDRLAPHQSHRWLFCMGDRPVEHDCGCCLNPDWEADLMRSDEHRCQCVCHERIASLAEHLARRMAMEHSIEKHTETWKELARL